jgi:hypothetical protein
MKTMFGVAPLREAPAQGRWSTRLQGQTPAVLLPAPPEPVASMGTAERAGIPETNLRIAARSLAPANGALPVR